MLVLRSVVGPTALITLLLALTVGFVLHASTSGTDRASADHQTHLVGVALRSELARIAKDQEASTNWDDAVLQINRRPLDVDWLDQNLGIWFHDYYGHDEVYILDPENRPVYAMRDGRRLQPNSFNAVRAPVAELTRYLRPKLARGDIPAPDAPGLTLGALELVVVHGRPAIVSMKPIVSETDKIDQIPGREHLHVSIRYLNGSLLDALASTYDIEALAFSSTPSAEGSLPLRSGSGVLLGYLTWKPFKPGGDVTKGLVPVLVIALLGICIALGWLFMRVLRARLELEASRAHAQHLAFHDPLTGLPNRALLANRIDQALGRMEPGWSIALILLDLDRFKNVNDTLGHLAGDALIVQFSRRLAGLVRSGDTIARLGGDEFAVLRTGVRSRLEINSLCDRILSAVRSPFEVLGSQVFVGVSMGVIIAPEDGTDRTELLRRADIALYSAKDEGRDRYRLFAPEMDAGVQLRGSLEEDLRAALETGTQLRLHYQPQVRHGGIVGVEALLRWQHPERGLIPPDQFIHVAEATGLIRALGDFVIREASTASRAWPSLRVAVNISPLQFRDPCFAERLAQIVAEAGAVSSSIQLEITESILLGDEDQVAATLRSLKQMGFSIALDDFGTGYSSLSYLQRFKVDKIKIDRSFVNALGHNDDAGAIISAVLALGRAMGLSVTAEGVETLAHRDFLNAAGCTEMQGFLFGAALPPEGIDLLLARGTTLAEA